MAGGRFFSPNIITNLCLWLYVNELLRFLCTWSWRWFHRLQSVKTFCFWSANQDISMVYKGIFMLFRKNLLNFLTKKTGAGLKTPEIFVSGSSNKKWRHIRFKLGRAARFTKRKNGGNPKTLTPGPRTPHYGLGPWTTYGPVHGLPLRTPLRTTRKIK